MPDDMNLKTYLPCHVEEEPVFPDHAELDPTGFHEPLVPGSRFHDEQWVMAAEMLARGASFMAVARAIGCGRTTLWRAYYKSTAFRRRVWWERQQLNKEAELRLGSVRAIAVEQLERLVSQGDPATVRWVCDRMGLFGERPSRRAASNPLASSPLPNPSPEAGEGPAESPSPVPGEGWRVGAGQEAGSEAMPHDEPEFTPADLAELEAPSDDPDLGLDDLGLDDLGKDGIPLDDFPIDDDDRVPGAMRERFPPSPEQLALVAEMRETRGTRGVHPWTANPDVEFPSLGSRRERAGAGVFEKR